MLSTVSFVLLNLLVCFVTNLSRAASPIKVILKCQGSKSHMVQTKRGQSEVCPWIIYGGGTKSNGIASLVVITLSDQ